MPDYTAKRTEDPTTRKGRPSPVAPDGRLEALAELAVAFGANVQPGQVVAVGSEPGKEELARAVAEQAYRRGAKFVDLVVFDPWVKRSRLLHAPEDTLDWVPPWYGERALALGDQRAARVALTGNAAPGLFDDLDPGRLGRDQLPWIKENAEVVNRRTTNWTVVPAPNPGWAGLVHPDLEPEAALERLWEEVAHVCRLDEPDPVAAWRERMDTVGRVAERLTERRFDALHFTGPGTDLRVGLLGGSRWITARFETVEGIEHMPNIPSEETFTTPDPERVEGVVAATKPLALVGGTTVTGLRVRFEGGRAVEIEAERGAEALRAMCARDPGAARLGEVALVDREGRVGPLDTIFYDTLLDENAASHVALGRAYGFAVDDGDRGRANLSDIHVDFMIGAEAVDVDGMTAGGEEVPILRGGSWTLR
jgi:aminopeptidase